MKSAEVFALILNAAELAACICGFITWHKWQGTPWRWFTLFLLFVVLGEAFGKYTLMHHQYTVNNFFFNYIEEPLEFLAAYTIFYASARDKRNARLPLICAGIYLACYLTDAIYVRFVLNSFSYAVGCILMLILILRFLITLAASEEILRFSRSMLFWVAVGWLLFYLGTLPYYGLRNTLAFKYHQLYMAYTYVADSLNTAMYLLFCTGFIWARPK